MSRYLLRGADGLGALLPDPVYENCAPTDTPCVLRNQAKGDAWEAARLAADNAQHLQWCLTQSGYPASDCYKTYGPGGTIAATANAGQPVQGFVPQPNLTPAQIQQTYNPGYVAASGVTVDSSGGSVFLPAGDKTTGGKTLAIPVTPTPAPFTHSSDVPPTGAPPATVAQYPIVECGFGQKQVWPAGGGQNTCAFDFETALADAWAIPGIYLGQMIPSLGGNASAVAWAAIVAAGYFAFRKGGGRGR